MIDQGKYNVLGVLIDAIDYEAAVAKIIQAAHTRQRLAVSALAVHGVMTGVLDPIHGARLNQFDLVAPDGQPVRWALNLLHGINLPDRVYGPTLTLKVCQRAAREGLPVYFYGSKSAVLEALTRNLCRQFPGLQVAGLEPSRFRRISPQEKAETIQKIHQSGAAIVLVGLGCPRQEVWVYEHRTALNLPMLAVGAAFDFYAGTLPQAPPILQRMGLEWSYRLFNEPQRLWRRYLLLNPHYLWLLAHQWLRLRDFPLHTDNLPIDEMRYG